MKRIKPGNYEGMVRAILWALMLLSIGFAVRGGVKMASSEQVEIAAERPCVIIDAGHGGKDPGKVGVDGSLEKDINLQIARKLQRFLVMADVDVVLTRESDAGLYDEDAPNKKVQDMKNRVSIIEEKKPDLTVSIHQNSYHEEYVHGAQVFYYAGSEESKELAGRIQQVMALDLDPDNTRQAKANDSYYLLKKTSSPIVIVECGFLSNPQEGQKLLTDEYQNKLAWGIYNGILNYFNEV